MGRFLAVFVTLILFSGGGVRAQDFPAAEVVLRGDAVTSPGMVARPDFPEDDGFAQQRRNMVQGQITARGVINQQVREAMLRVPRHEFVPRAEINRAYGDHPLPIGHGQTISQPYIVAYMTEVLQLEPTDRVLEIGTGSAYQAAVLAEIVDETVTIEIVDALARSAAALLENLGYTNVTVLSGDGYFGYPDRAPYDAIMVTAAAEHIPPPLLDQLKPGGRMVIPVGRAGWMQNLILVEKQEDGSVVTENLLPVRFVPLTRQRR